jgi:dienelactone hydrolase
MRLNHLLHILALCVPSLSLAAVVEEVIEVPVSVKTIYGQEANQPIKVTVFRDDKRESAPYLVLNHGRPATEADFAKMKRQRYSENSRYFVALGFVVLVPTRVGYGESGGPDVEYSGRCDSKNYTPVYAASADQTVAVLKAAANLPYVDLARGIVVGQSFGGMTSITLSTRALPGLVGAVNFAGGGGGNPTDRPENPCSAYRLTALYEDYGAVSKVPTLWLYSENDRYWGSELPKEWFTSFVRAGGKAQFVQLPPYKDNGHSIFSGNPNAWKSAFESFLHEVGF